MVSLALCPSLEASLQKAVPCQSVAAAGVVARKVET
jgi:hypothetical protein